MWLKFKSDHEKSDYVTMQTILNFIHMTNMYAYNMWYRKFYNVRSELKLYMRLESWMVGWEQMRSESRISMLVYSRSGRPVPARTFALMEVSKITEYNAYWVYTQVGKGFRWFKTWRRGSRTQDGDYTTRIYDQ